MPYSSVSVIALLVVLITSYDLLFSRNFSDKFPAHKQYRLFLLSVALFFVADLLWGIFNDYHLYPANYIITVIYFILVSTSVCLWAFYVVAFLGRKRIVSHLFEAVGLLFLVGGIVAVVINFFIPIVFDFATNGDYVFDGFIFRKIFFIMQAVMFFVTSVYAFTNVFVGNKSYKDKIKHVTIGIFGLEMGVVIALEIFFPLQPIYAFGYLLGLIEINTFVVVEQKKEYRIAIAQGLDNERRAQEELGRAKYLVYTDSLTGAKSKYALVEREEQIDKEIADGKDLSFAVAVFDLNDLKFVNDRLGHATGDQYLLDSANMIRAFFKESELYRYGGDEFVLIINGDEYNDRRTLFDAFKKQTDKNASTGNPVTAAGFSDYLPGKDNTFHAVFARADQRMYIAKKELKEIGKLDISKLGSKKNDMTLYRKFIQEEIMKQKDGKHSTNNRRLSFYKSFYLNEECSLIDMLTNSSADEVMEVNAIDDTFKQFYRVDGKYFVPSVQSSYREAYKFAVDHMVHPDDKKIYADFMNPDNFLERIRKNSIPNFGVEQFRYKLQDGDYRYVEQVVIAGQENSIPEGCFRIYVFDVHNYVARQNGFISYDKDVISRDRDSVTNLLLEKDFFTIGQDVIDDHPDYNWCLISIDIKHFRFFGQWYGREASNLLLARIGAFFAENESKYGGLSGYFGKDNFAMLMPYDEKKVDVLYDELRDVIVSYSSTAGFTPIFGIAMIEKGLSLLDAFDQAAIAANKAKKDIATRICIYTYEMQFIAQKESQLLSEYMEAFKNNEITFFLQPQCRISSKKIVGAEALARWVKKDGSMVSPGLFVPVLEKYGFIPNLDIYVWEQACMTIRRWLDEGRNVVPISLNVAREDFFVFDVAQYFIDLASKYQIPHNLIKIEITESSYVEATELVEKTAEKLHDNGFLILMDDFGSGYSSLNMLGSIDIDAIKLDMNFLHFDGKDYEKAIHVLESVINMAKVMALPIIMEGVEKKEHCDFVESLGCRYIQGYYFYQPMPIDEFEKLIFDERIIDNRGFVVKLNEQMRTREFMDKNIFSDSMLNNIIGPVAFFTWNGKRTNIIRFNEQFYKALNIPNFNEERIVDIERFVVTDDTEKMHQAFKSAMEDKLNGSHEYLRFNAFDGTILSFRVHFYYLGKQEGEERFYGAVQNVTALTDLLEEKKLHANYSTDGQTYIKKVGDRMVFSVASRNISDIFDITPEQLEEELNNGEFVKRHVANRRKYDQFNKAFIDYTSQNKNFEASIDVYDSHRQVISLYLGFTSVSDLTNNIAYIMKARI